MSSYAGYAGSQLGNGHSGLVIHIVRMMYYLGDYKPVYLPMYW